MQHSPNTLLSLLQHPIHVVNLPFTISLRRRQFWQFETNRNINIQQVLACSALGKHWTELPPAELSTFVPLLWLICLCYSASIQRQIRPKRAFSVQELWEVVKSICTVVFCPGTSRSYSSIYVLSNMQGWAPYALWR